MPDLLDLVNFPFVSPPSTDIYGEVEASTTYTSIVTGVANTKGNWVELVASTPQDLCGLLLCFRYPAARISVDIGVGADPPTVLIPDVMPQASGGTAFDRSLFIPIFIARGTRISVRAQSSSATLTVLTALVLLFQPRSPNRFPPSGFPSLSFGAVESAGFDAANTAGTTITADASAHVKGSWTQLIASTARRVGYVILSVGQASSLNPYMLDIGIGASPTVLVGDLIRFFSNSGWYTADGFPLRILPGTKISARCQCSVAGSATIKVAMTLLEVV